MEVFIRLYSFHYSVHLVELCGTGQFYAMKAMDKTVMLNRNKVFKVIYQSNFIASSDFI